MKSKENLDTARPPLLLSHGPGCFDGTTCAVAVSRYYGTRSLIPHFTHPSQLDSIIQKLSTTTTNPHDLWILDMAWKDNKTDLLLHQLIEQGWRVFWIDHHRNAIEKPKSEIENINLTGYTISPEYAASYLLFDFLNTLPQISPSAGKWLSSFEKTVKLADEHDRWLHDGKEGHAMQLALAIEQLARHGSGLEGYHELLDISEDATLTPKLLSAYKNAKKELEKSLLMAQNSKVEYILDDLNLTILYAKCNKYSSQVGNTLKASLDNGIIVLFSESDGRYSLRKSNSCKVNLANIATLLGGGGHPSAAGFQLSTQEYNPSDFLPKIEAAIKTLHTSHKLNHVAQV